MSGEQKRFGGNRLKRTGAALSLTAVIGLGTAACGFDIGCLVCYTEKTKTPAKPSPTPPPTSYDQDALQPHTAVPNLTRYKKGKVCPDPSLAMDACVVPIYREPKIPKGQLDISNTVNVTDGMGDRQWPHVWDGSMTSQQRDEVTAVCQVMGEKVTDQRDSEIWDVVRIPPEHASTAVLYDAMNPNAVPKLGHDTVPGNDQAVAVYGFMPDVFFDPPIVGVPECTNQQNPMHYQNAS